MRARWLVAAIACAGVACDAIYGIQQLPGGGVGTGGDAGPGKDASVSDGSTGDDGTTGEDSAAGDDEGGFVDVKLSCPFDGAVGANAALEWAEWPMPNDPTDVSAGAPNAESYTNNGDGTATDNVTGLMWMESPSSVTNGDTIRNVLNLCAELSLAGHCDWRLPTYVELASILDESRTPPTINPSFKNTAPDGFWSSTPVADASPAGSEYWVVNFSNGQTDAEGTGGHHHARCVRGSGVADAGPPPGRYVVGSGTVMDLATGLTWQQGSATSAGMNASSHCAGLSLDGPSPWRLPTVGELVTLVNVAQAFPAIDSVFPTQNNPYWSSSPFPGSTTSAWTVNFTIGGVSSKPTANGYAVRCVR